MCFPIYNRARVRDLRQARIEEREGDAGGDGYTSTEVFFCAHERGDPENDGAHGRAILNKQQPCHIKQVLHWGTCSDRGVHRNTEVL